MKLLLGAIIFFVFHSFLPAQVPDTIPREKINIHRTLSAPKIDGKLDDPSWENGSIANNFVERNPTNVRPIPDSLRTEVKINYDDLGTYFAATMNDPVPQNPLQINLILF